MTNKIKYLFLATIFCLISNITYSQENYCLDKEGLILPIFDSDNCDNSNDIKIDQKEFKYIIEVKASERISKLNEFRKNRDEILSNENALVENRADQELEEKKKLEIATTQKKRS